jgi:hypothetical protein
MDKITGIYQIQSKKTRRIYIGSAVNIVRRWSQHLSNLKLQKHHSTILQNHFNKHGKDDFIFSVLLSCDKEELIKHEQFFIDALNPYFNIRKIAESCLGIKASMIARQHMREAHLGKRPSEETRKKRSVSMLGKNKGSKLTDEQYKRLVESHKGKHFSEETRKKMSESQKGIIKNVGRKASLETRQKMSKARKGRFVGVNNPMFGRKLSIEAKLKDSIAVKAWHASRKLKKSA